MIIKYIEVTDLRNLQNVKLMLDNGFNIFYGLNGSGKTSFLESVFMLGHGRSFRNRSIHRIVRENQEKLSVFAKISARKDEIIPIGVERDVNGLSRYKVSTQYVNSAAELAQLLPIKLINQDSYLLVEAGPKYRRQFLDWGLFHVEQSFYDLWKSYQRILKQRNALLRRFSNLQELKSWDNELIMVTNQIHKLREHYIRQFLPIFESVLQKLLGNFIIKIQYWPGWPRNEAFSDVLAQSINKDKDSGYTHYGPHRADLKITIRNIPVESILSRGQQKMLVNTMHIAQGMLLQENCNKSCTFLLDDLSAELDVNHKKMIIDMLNQLNAQVFITVIESQDIKDILCSYPAKMFHVEHGQITPEENGI